MPPLCSFRLCFGTLQFVPSVCPCCSLESGKYNVYSPTCAQYKLLHLRQANVPIRSCGSIMDSQLENARIKPVAIFKPAKDFTDVS